MSEKGRNVVKQTRTPLAFMSYSRFVDTHDQGQLTTFRERLSGEIQVQTGEEFPIFQDRQDIQWGQQWQERIEESLDEVTFLIPILTPSFFKSHKCREELEKFLEREKELVRCDLILPVYYIGYPLLDDEERRKSDKLAQIIANRQFADWRDLRFEPFTNTLVRKTLAQMAIQIREAMESRQPPQKEIIPKPILKTESLHGEAAPQVSQPDVSMGKPAGFRTGPSAKTEPPTRIVHPMHRGDFATITEAIQAADPGDRILVYPGLYEEGLVLDKPLEIVGVGGPEEVIVQTKGKNALSFRTTMGRVANLSLRQIGEGEWFCVDISQGRLELEDCDITSHSLACVGIHSGADPRLRRNRIHNSKQSGVFVYDNGQGTLEDNDIFDNTFYGVEIKTGGNPFIRRNRIHDAKQSGVFVYENGQGILEDNDIFGNAYSGVAIKTGGNPLIRRNRIHDGKQSGVFVYENGQGALEDNDIFCNTLAGVAIREGGNPALRRNRIHDGKQSGVFVYENGIGIIEDNDIFNNAYAGVRITTGGNPTIRRNHINQNGYEGLWIDNGGGGTIEDNDLRNNVKGPWDIAAACESKVKRARNLVKNEEPAK